MSYYLTRKIHSSFDVILSRLKDLLHDEDYLIASEIDVQGALKQKLGAELPQIRIIGTNTPRVGFQLFSSDPRLGTLLPFSMVIHEIDQSNVEVTMVDPVWLFGSIDSAEINSLAAKIKLTFEKILDNL